MRSALLSGLSVGAILMDALDFSRPEPVKPRSRAATKRTHPMPRPRRPATPNEAYLGQCCNYALCAYGRYYAAAPRLKRLSLTPEKFFGGPPPRTKADAMAALSKQHKASPQAA